MIHDFDYSRYKSCLENCGFKNNVDIIKINPVYTSIIGDEKYNDRMKLNRQQGAAFVISNTLNTETTKSQIQINNPKM